MDTINSYRNSKVFMVETCFQSCVFENANRIPNLPSWWLNQPIPKNISVKLDHLPKDRGENKKIFELPPPVILEG